MNPPTRPMTVKDAVEVERIFRANLGGAGEGPQGFGVEKLLKTRRRGVVALVALDAKGRVAGYLIGEVRAWEFGSEPSGWIFALGVDPKATGKGLGKALRDAAIAAFRGLGVERLRTMVRRDDAAVLRFFRDAGFAAGPYVELELEL